MRASNNLTLPFLLLLLAIAACNTGPGDALPEDTRNPSIITNIPIPKATEPLLDKLPPSAVIKATIPAPKVTAIPTHRPHSTASLSPSITAVASETPTETPPPPTFTPPPPPPTDPNEHYLLERPVGTSSASWTDKAYPYGSTRGGTLRPHHGVEFNVPSNTPVLAAATGSVIVAGNDSAELYGPQTNFYGNLIVIEHNDAGNPVFTLYGHLSEVDVEIGQSVQAGEVIGLSGESGVAYGPHLHFEVREGKNDYTSTRNPVLWLRPFPATGTFAARITGPDGALINEAPVLLRRIDGPAPYSASTTYAISQVNADRNWQENLAIDDVLPGYYTVEIGRGSRPVRVEQWIYPGRTNFTAIQLER